MARENANSYTMIIVCVCVRENRIQQPKKHTFLINETNERKMRVSNVLWNKKKLVESHYVQLRCQLSTEYEIQMCGMTGTLNNNKRSDNSTSDGGGGGGTIPSRIRQIQRGYIHTTNQANERTNQQANE